MTLKLLTKEVGPWPMNVYVIICQETNKSAIIDPGSDPDAILSMIEGTKVTKIFITHAHEDHVQALDAIKRATGVPVYMHPDEKEKFGINYDISLHGGDNLKVGNTIVKTIHTPGHTPGMISLSIGKNRIVVGDTIFVGGPGRTNTPKDFSLTMKTMQNIVFKWPDEVKFYPGHGPSGIIGEERPAFEAFLSKGWSMDKCGDVTWSD